MISKHFSKVCWKTERHQRHKTCEILNLELSSLQFYINLEEPIFFDILQFIVQTRSKLSKKIENIFQFSR